ncbi:MAG: hypothetical protein SFW09_13520 [Hyphomicrobiaceae bacterium]|nr:hypothetical protein [Hyphomicrobiaceae bacterium]
MVGIARAFFTSALVYGVVGMLLGLSMAMQHNHSQMPTHAHVMVIGWVSFAIFGLFYTQHAKSVPRILSYIHFWLAQLSLLGLVVGLWLIYSGQTQYDPVAAVSSTAYALSFVLFAIIALLAMRMPKV